MVFKALEKIKEISPNTEIIMFTAYAATESVIDAIDKGAFSYLPKPFEMTDLRVTLEKACERQTLLFENRKLFDQVLEGKQDWENTFDSIKDLISIHDVDSNITRCNKALADKLNAKPEDIVGGKCFKIFHGRNEPLPGCAILRCIETLKKTEEETECMGGVFLMSYFPRFDKSGNFIGIVHDIGKMHIPTEILSRPGKLTKDEFNAFHDESLKVLAHKGYPPVSKEFIPNPRSLNGYLIFL